MRTGPNETKSVFSPVIIGAAKMVLILKFWLDKRSKEGCIPCSEGKRGHRNNGEEELVLEQRLKRHFMSKNVEQPVLLRTEST